MRFIQLHTKNTNIVYKNSLCSFATIVVLVLLVLSVMIPLLLVSLLSPYSGITADRILFEQPRVHYKYKYVFLAQFEDTKGNTTTVACSAFANFNDQMQNYGKKCAAVKYWEADLDFDGKLDKAYFEQHLKNPTGRLVNLELILFFEAELKRKCHLQPPAILVYQLPLPVSKQLNSGTVVLKSELKMRQNLEFRCPYPGRNIKTRFHKKSLDLDHNTDLEDFKLENLLEQIKRNPAFFQLDVNEIYYKLDASEQLRVQLELEIVPVSARYNLSVWERLGQFWLYFASFFGVSFYIVNKMKDCLFGQHIVRAWEIIPWKKLY